MELNDMVSYDIIIIGAGASGVSASVYAKRAGKKVAIMERMAVGGQLNFVGKIANYAGFVETDGFSLSQNLQNQLKQNEIEVIYDEVIDLKLDGEKKELICKKNNYTSTAVILALGSNPKELEINGEKEFKGRGVSYCVQCDGNFFRGKTTAVVGSSEAAINGAIYLSAICEKVYLIAQFNIDNLPLEQLKKLENVEILRNAKPLEIKGDEVVKSIIIEQENEKKAISVDGIFVVAGNKPSTAMLKGKIELTEEGYIICNEDMMTSEEGVYACGDVRKSRLKQISTAVGDGAIAGVMATTFVSSK